MVNQQHLKLLKSEGPYLWNEWRRTNPTVKPDLHEANLAGLRFEKGNLGQADPRGADLSWARLWGANLFSLTEKWIILICGEHRLLATFQVFSAYQS